MTAAFLLISMIWLCGFWRGNRVMPVRPGVFLALAEICDCGSRSDAARIGGVGLQIVRDWVLDVDHVRLRPSRPAIHGKARRLHHMDFDATPN